MADQTTLLVSNDEDANGAFGDDDEWDQLFAEINETEVAPELCVSSYKFENITIKFPYEAYLSQLQMMEKIIEGVTKGENCLLESPTGTGKTAAILCALLAWQKDCYNSRDYCGSVIDAAVERLGHCSCGFIKDEERTKVTISRDKKGKVRLTATTYEPPESPRKEAEASVTTTPPSTPKQKSALATLTSPAKDPSTPSCSSTCSESPNNKCSVLTPSNFESPLKKLKLATTCEVESTETRRIDNLCGYCVRKHFRDRARPPRIYYCTRTHSQIAQVVAQLKTSVYKTTPMTILASREPTCISNLKDKENLLRQQLSSQERKEDPKLTVNDICRESVKKFYKNKLNDPEKIGSMSEDDLKKLKQDLNICEFFQPKFELKHIYSGFQKQNGAFDLEDVKKEGESCGKCPYYGCYAMHENADLILCSYNYLIDPSLREITDIKYANSVLVFDEAHNIEDICRTAFTLVIDVTALDRDVRGCVDNLLKKTNDGSTHNASRSTQDKLIQASDTLKKWSDYIQDKGRKLEFVNHNRNAVKQESYENQELLKLLTEMGLTADSVNDCLEKIGQPSGGVEDKDNANADDTLDSDGGMGLEEYYLNSRGERRPFKVAASVGHYLQRLLLPLVYLCQKEQEGIGGVKDFKGFLTRTPNPAYSREKTKLSKAGADGVQVKEEVPEFLYQFEIICLNPAVGFRALRNCAYSIIVASGTLTPLASFAGELATNFAVKLQASHVIPTSNVWAGVISKGPRNIPLKLIKDHQGDVNVQDEVGQIIHNICYTVPNGVLVFFPSYALMRTMTERWRENPAGNSLLHRISKRKLIFFEDSKDKQLFKQNMERYKEEVKGGPTWDGCILFAVFRGKISEGIDFKDEQARAVITIGIPYSNAVAPGVSSKKAYNDMMRRQQGTNRTADQLLSGQEWYTTQAFRAMNQGFGRCVRHLSDWGALIMIDQRMSQNNNQPYISGWIRNSLLVPAPESFEEIQQNLRLFIQRMQRKDKANKKRKHIRAEYERENSRVDPNPYPKSSRRNDDLADDITKISTQSIENYEEYQADDDNADLPTQVMNMSTSTIFSQEDNGNVRESSPEYSFSEEIEFATQEPSPPPIIGMRSNLLNGSDRNNSPLDEGNNAVADDDNDSISVYGPSPTPSPPPVSSTPMPSQLQRVRNVSVSSANDSDMELSRMVDEIESVASQDGVNNDGTLDVSMQSLTEQDFSQGSSISYHSQE